MKKDGKRKIGYVIGVIAVFLLAGAIGFYIGVILPADQEPEEEDNRAVISQSDLNTITYEGEKYRYNSSLFNILFLGIDNNEEIREDHLPGEAGQSDCIMLLTLNKETKKAQILQIPRDTMTEVDLYDTGGNYYASVQEQLATQYSYGNGGTGSCWAVKKTVSELLYDIPIDAYLSMDMASISIINDAVGGVTITIPEDYTEIDPAFEKDATLTLTGKQADAYVHYRDTNVSFSNNDRMKRQVQYIPALITAIRNRIGSGGNYYEVFYPLVEKYVLTDLREDEINELAGYDLVDSETQFVPGEGKQGEIYEEFYVDEENLQKMIIKTFYILVE